MTTDPLAFLRAAHAEAEKAAEAARDVDYAQCGAWEARGPYPAECGEADGVSRPRGNLRAEIGKDDIFLDAELPWGLVPHMALHHPAAVLRRIAADRKAIERHRDDGHGKCVECGQGYELSDWGPDVPCDTIRDLASGWDWKEEAGTDADAPA